MKISLTVFDRKRVDVSMRKRHFEELVENTALRSAKRAATTARLWNKKNLLRNIFCSTCELLQAFAFLNSLNVATFLLPKFWQHGSSVSQQVCHTKNNHCSINNYDRQASKFAAIHLQW